MQNIHLVSSLPCHLLVLRFQPQQFHTAEMFFLASKVLSCPGSNPLTCLSGGPGVSGTGKQIKTEMGKKEKERKGKKGKTEEKK